MIHIINEDLHACNMDLSIKSYIEQIESKIKSFPRCVICQDHVKISQQIATYTCNCKFICHHDCIYECPEDERKCPLCGQRKPITSDSFQIWTDKTKIDKPLIGLNKIKQKYDELIQKSMKSSKSVKPMMKINREMGIYSKSYKHNVISVNQLIDLDSQLVRFKPIDLDLFNDFFTIFKHYKGKRTIFRSGKDRMSVYPHFGRNIENLLKINDQITLKNVTKYTGICLAGGCIYRSLTNSKLPNDIDIDMFVTGSKDEKNIALQYLLSVFNEQGVELDIIVYNRIINIYVNNKLIQVIVTDFSDPYQVVRGFDLTHCQYFYEDEQVYGTYDAILAIQTRVSKTTTHVIDHPRLRKTQNLGYTVMAPLDLKIKYTNVQPLTPAEVLVFQEYRSKFKYIHKDPYGTLDIQPIISYVLNNDTPNKYSVVQFGESENLFHLNYETIQSYIDIMKQKPNDFSFSDNYDYDDEYDLMEEEEHISNSDDDVEDVLDDESDESDNSDDDVQLVIDN